MIKEILSKYIANLLNMALFMISIFTFIFIDSFILNILDYLFYLSEELRGVILIITYFVTQIITLVLFYTTNAKEDLILTFVIHIITGLIFSVMFLVLKDVPFELQLIFACGSIVFFVAYAQMSINTNKRINYIHTFPKLVFITALIIHVFLKDDYHFLPYTFLLVPLSDLLFLVFSKRELEPQLKDYGIDLRE